MKMKILKMAVFAVSFLPVSAFAEQALEVPLGHASLIKLVSVPTQIIVGNPTIADVTVQSAKSLAVFGKHSGGTSLTALDAKGNVLWERTVVVVMGDAEGVTVHYGTGKNWSPGGTSVAVACSSIRCSDPMQAPADSSQKPTAK
jgi:Flp pilus assembly secretin CpaC